MKMRRVHRIDIEALVVIGFAVVVEVDQPCDLISSQHQDLFLSRLAAGQQPERLTEATGDALPAEVFEPGVEAIDSPDVTVPGRDRRRIPSIEEVKITKSHPGVPGILVGPGDPVDLEGVFLSDGACRLQIGDELTESRLRAIPLKQFSLDI